ncbi:hypothetical protein WN51_09334 [Melipona quadrifasciata]|uniref:Uncharacterized protein n=1 Tax=Melipona quadrifasciata TaxID=166423 RepID=A0A0M9A7W6_9HYME|nr:hypothetical protein WN51_09334 [Melipona quadrifasciata]
MHRADVALMSGMNSEARMRANILRGPRLLPAAGIDVDGVPARIPAGASRRRRFNAVGTTELRRTASPCVNLMPLFASPPPGGWRSWLLQRPPAFAEVDGTFGTFRGIFDLYRRV